MVEKNCTYVESVYFCSFYVNTDNMFNINSKNVLITGGASGIGKIMGRICLEKGAASLIVWDINEANMAAAKADLEKVPGAAGKVFTYKVNVADD